MDWDVLHRMREHVPTRNLLADLGSWGSTIRGQSRRRSDSVSSGGSLTWAFHEVLASDAGFVLWLMQRRKG